MQSRASFWYLVIVSTGTPRSKQCRNCRKSTSRAADTNNVSNRELTGGAIDFVIVFVVVLAVLAGVKMKD
jgi:hypothetical protein